MVTQRLTLEIAVETAADALAAQRGGADRLELCSGLHFDGLTPALKTDLPEIKRMTSLPVVVMIRPRAGDFCYDGPELAMIRSQIGYAVRHGADGLVFGAVRADGTVNVGGCAELIARCAGRPTVFHRAFDRTPDPFQALEQLIDLGFTRILTSGRQADKSRPPAAALIAELIDRAAGRIEIMPGGGVRPHNAAALIRATGCTQVHSSCRQLGATTTDEQMVADLRLIVDAWDVC